MPWTEEDQTFTPISGGYYPPPIVPPFITPAPPAPPTGGALPPAPPAPPPGGVLPPAPPPVPPPAPSLSPAPPPIPSLPHPPQNQHTHDDDDYIDNDKKTDSKKSPTPMPSPIIRDRCKTGKTTGYKGKQKVDSQNSSDLSLSYSPDSSNSPHLPYHPPLSPSALSPSSSTPGFRYQDIPPKGTFGRKQPVIIPLSQNLSLSPEVSPSNQGPTPPRITKKTVDLPMKNKKGKGQ
ncbi:hypothetical protein FRB95_007078 [Tulasnella sp. JGI-2019a]|nr:hypothetical protein FRB95_007078 [Tulasnella sp. JGI-2019a]